MTAFAGAAAAAAAEAADVAVDDDVVGIVVVVGVVVVLLIYWLCKNLTFGDCSRIGILTSINLTVTIHQMNVAYCDVTTHAVSVPQHTHSKYSVKVYPLLQTRHAHSVNASFNLHAR